MTYGLYQILIMTALVSFLGWCLENLWLLFRKGYADNRNMTFPFLLGYGAAIGLTALMTWDFLHSLRVMHRSRALNDRWRWVPGGGLAADREK